ncbi:prephenate dehydratase [Reticulibacter mediterranei]|uniref:Prephenate dehydratase n=1 Tax=Reticulibacter mediterranei TaxID=2778369 RepID=A0A8J3N2Y1_9CHLR|nr:prephenate dehydratase [Reticulibacter mediterranei]GHO92582.1 prephenate dehydratase [Reticulibacter mediterranei]
MIPAQNQEDNSTIDQPPTQPHSMNVAFQGVSGAFSEEAVYTYFEQDMGQPIQKYSYQSFADVFAAVAKGSVAYGVVPLENSQTGSIDEVYDLLASYDLFVVGEVCVPVNQCLMCLPGQRLSDIKRVFSHPQALAQCKEYLGKLAVEVNTASNTAASAKMIQEAHLENTAAIAGPRAAELYQLEILAQNIQTVKENYTRFLVLGKTQGPYSDQQSKTMLAITMARQSLALSHYLTVFAAHGLQLVRVETRPSRQQPWETIYFVEIAGHSEDPKVRCALNDVATYTSMCKLLGSFQRAV